MEYNDVMNNWNSFSEAIRKLGGKVQSYSVDRPATVAEIAALEEKLGFDLPASLKEILLKFSRKVEFRWFLPDSFKFDGSLSQIFCGDRHWSLDWIWQFNESKNSWVEQCFPNKEDPYDAIWHDKLAFHEVGNGDYLAIDLSKPGYEPIVYLSHDDGEGHGIELAENFKEFVFITSRLGCVGGEDWQLLPFISKDKPYMDADCENAVKFREVLGVMV